MTSATLSSGTKPHVATIDAEVLRQILPTYFTILRDVSGETVGYVLCPETYQQLMLAWAKQDITAEEIDQARASLRQRGGRSHAEVMERLRSLDQPREEAA